MAIKRIHRPCGALLQFGTPGTCWYCHAELAGEDIVSYVSDDPQKSSDPPKAPWNPQPDVIKGVTDEEKKSSQGQGWFGSLAIYVLITVVAFFLLWVMIRAVHWMWTTSIG
jgi:hypothetical protein